MQIELRDPKKIMKLSRLGSFHQSKLSFLRSFLREFKDWDYKRDMFDLDENGLKKVGFDNNDISAILGNNWFNFYREI